MGKYLVTGGCGFIGSTLVDKLVNFGHEVLVIDNLSSKSHDRFYFSESPKVNYEKKSVTDYASCFPLFKKFNPDVVFHLAAMTSVRESMEEPGTCMLTNVVGTQNMLGLSKLHEAKRFVFMSSSAVYGSSQKKSQKESDDTVPISPYGYSKLFGENLCRMNSQLFGLDTVCFRSFNTYGPRQPKLGECVSVIAKFEKQKDAGSALTIFGDGEQTRDFIHVDDVCNALVAGALETEPQRGEIYNLGTGKSYSINEIAEMVGGAKEYLTAVSGEARNTLANISKAKVNLGWLPKKSLEDYYIK